MWLSATPTPRSPLTPPLPYSLLRLHYCTDGSPPPRLSSGLMDGPMLPARSREDLIEASRRDDEVVVSLVSRFWCWCGLCVIVWLDQEPCGSRPSELWWLWKWKEPICLFLNIHVFPGVTDKGMLFYCLYFAPFWADEDLRTYQRKDVGAAGGVLRFYKISNLFNFVIIISREYCAVLNERFRTPPAL